MQITPLYLQYDNKYKSPAFGDCAIKHAGDRLAMHFTHLGRDLEVDRQKLADHVVNLVNNSNLGCEFLFCGCSDGSEIFDIMMAIVYKFYKENIPLDKLPKFKAFDISQEIIDIAKKGRINISNEGVDYIKKSYPYYPFWGAPQGIVCNPGDNIGYLELKIGSTIKNSYQFNPELLNKIDFYRGLMLSEFQKIDPDTCKIVFCRNVARYNSESYQREAARELDKNLKSGSLVVVGYCDEHNPLDANNNVISGALSGDCDSGRVPFADELYKGRFFYNKYISPDYLVYQKI